jgi:hypothetical protein
MEWVKFYHFWPKNDYEKWSRHFYFEVHSCALRKLENVLREGWKCEEKQCRYLWMTPFRLSKWNPSIGLLPTLHHKLQLQGWLPKVKVCSVLKSSLLDCCVNSALTMIMTWQYKKVSNTCMMNNVSIVKYCVGFCNYNICGWERAASGAQSWRAPRGGTKVYCYRGVAKNILAL